jgi:hypothetical protein
MRKQSKKDQIEKRRTFACGGFDGQDVCKGVIGCQRCGNCLLHCACTRDARVEPGAEMLAGEQLALCERPQFAWKDR